MTAGSPDMFAMFSHPFSASIRGRQKRDSDLMTRSVLPNGRDISLTFPNSKRSPALATLLVALLGVQLINPSFAGPIDELQPGEWYEIPNSRMRPVTMSPNSKDPSAVMWAWSGGAYDSFRDRLIVWGGGHNDYAGNELYAFDLNTLTWERLTDPSSLSGFSEGSWTMPDGRPKSVHTYDQLQFDPVSRKFFATAGSTYQQGTVTSTTWLFNFNTNSWERQQNVPGPVYDLLQLSLTSDYDPVSQRIVMLGQKSSGDFNPATGEWRKHGSSMFGDRPLGHTGAIHPQRRKFVTIGRGSAYVFDVSSSGALSNRRSLNSNGAKEIENYDAPGLVYDPQTDRLVAWGSGQDVYSLDLSTTTWTRHNATNSVSPGNPYTDSRYNGTFGRFRYVPSRNVFIVVGSIDTNVFVYKLSDGAQGPPPATVPESPTALLIAQ